MPTCIEDINIDCWRIIFKFLNYIEQSTIRCAFPKLVCLPISVDYLKSSTKEIYDHNLNIIARNMYIVADSFQVSNLTRSAKKIDICIDDLKWFSENNLYTLFPLLNEIKIFHHFEPHHYETNEYSFLNDKTIECPLDIVSILPTGIRRLTINSIDGKGVIDLSRFNNLVYLRLNHNFNETQLILPSSIISLYCSYTTTPKYLMIGNIICSVTNNRDGIKTIDLSNTKLKNVQIHANLILPDSVIEAKCYSILNIRELTSLRIHKKLDMCYDGLIEYPKSVEHLNYNVKDIKSLKQLTSNLSVKDFTYSIAIDSIFNYIEVNSNFVKCLDLDVIKYIRQFPKISSLHIISTKKYDINKILLSLNELNYLNELRLEDCDCKVDAFPSNITKLTLIGCNIELGHNINKSNIKYLSLKIGNFRSQNIISMLPYGLITLDIADDTFFNTDILPDSVVEFMTINKCVLNTLPLSIEKLDVVNAKYINPSRKYDKLYSLTCMYCDGLKDLFLESKSLIYFKLHHHDTHGSRDLINIAEKRKNILFYQYKYDDYGDC